jgi:hypothetical protein
MLFALLSAYPKVGGRKLEACDDDEPVLGASLETT